MATTKKSDAATAAKSGGATGRGIHEATFDEAVEKFGSAIKLMHGGNYDDARKSFLQVEQIVFDEPELIERSRSYASICVKRMTATPVDAQDADTLYYRGVLRANDGRYDEALAALDGALKQQPQSARALYARSTVWALKGNAQAAVSDLRQAIGIDPQVRFQAVNDSDFEPIREEPSFIDIIEPTPTGA